MVDALRGFALAGVSLAHIMEQYIAGAPPEGFMSEINGLPDQIVQGIIEFFVRGKFFALFSILFGLSFSIQMESAAKRHQDFRGRFIWRAVLLLLLGYVHHLFYRGDILTIYALLAPFIIPFYRISHRWILLTAGVFLLSVPRFIAFALIGNESLFGLESGFQTAADAAYFEIVKSGSLKDVFHQNAWYGMKTKMSFQLSAFARFYFTFGYFLLGLWIGKMGVFRHPDQRLPFIKNALHYSLAAMGIAFIITAIVFSTASQPIDFSKWHHVIGINVFDWFNVSMTIVIISGFILLYRKESWQRKLNRFAPYGRMALTNYIFQTIIGTFLLFGWGLGFLGQIRTLYLILIGIALILVQMIISKWWLSKFKFGPLEWLWRSGTYLKWQTFRN
jgi:uncharacterized protein